MVVAIALIFVVSSDPPIALFTLFCCYAFSGYVYWAWRWYKTNRIQPSQCPSQSPPTPDVPASRSSAVVRGAAIWAYSRLT